VNKVVSRELQTPIFVASVFGKTGCLSFLLESGGMLLCLFLTHKKESFLAL
jgi:hypothetical protein